MIVIFNSDSGRRNGIEPLSTALRSAGIDARILTTQTGCNITPFVEEAIRSDHPVIVAAGGDGTISTIASALASTDKILGVIPLGTFNFFARRLKVPLDLDAAVKALVHSRATTIDIGEVNGRSFINNSSIGIYPAALRERERAYESFGRNRLVAYFAGAVALIRQSRRVLDLRLNADGRVRTVRSPFIFVCNNRDQLDFYRIRGSECLSVGMLAVYTSPPLTGVQMLRLGMRMVLRRLDRAEDYVAICTGDMEVKARRPQLEVALDGERVMLKTPLHYRMRHGALRVLVPAEN